MDELFDGETYTLTDEDGNENPFELLGSAEINGKTYMALEPVDGNDQYVILRRETAPDGDETLVTIDDDEEFDRVADYFEDTLFAEIDYDADSDDADGNDDTN